MADPYLVQHLRATRDHAEVMAKVAKNLQEQMAWTEYGRTIDAQLVAMARPARDTRGIDDSYRPRVRP